MPAEPIQILLIDDEESIRRMVEKEISDQRRIVRTAGCAREGFDLLRKYRFDVLVLDIRLPDGNGLELFDTFSEAAPDLEVIFITGHGDIESAVEAMKKGAYDFIAKPFDPSHLELIIEKAYQRVRLRRENRVLRYSQNEVSKAPQLIGDSQALQHVWYLIEKVAPTDAPVLITGESGVGKDVVANIIHSRSGRSQQSLVVKNCGLLQRELVRSELFGHCKGAFTGATETRDGLLALAHGGTLFLDEIGELSTEVQASLLRVIEDGTIRRVGDKVERHVNVRFLFATNRDLAQEARAGRFHEALYYRINAFQIHIPPLRDRKEDIPLLVDYFLERLSAGKCPCRLSSQVMRRLQEYAWPGNIRELKNVIERGVILSERGVISTNALPGDLADKVEPGIDKPSSSTLREMEKLHIERMLERTSGNRFQAADLLGISMETLCQKLLEYNLEDSSPEHSNLWSDIKVATPPLRDHKEGEEAVLEHTDGTKLLSLDQIVVQQIRQALETTKGRISGPRGAAQLLGVNPNTLRSRMRKLGISFKSS
ncbi:MAG TPA: sigma 54-interacting transcriptional regulator [Desulfomonilaceae bacterium]|nr:sigma 54-interacting transcriptional regulator [Desulfomonilaceae bacterium]